MKRKELIGLIIVILVIAMIILSFILYNELPLLTGERIVLATMPVDPFDPFMGQYMDIRYEISNLNDVKGFEEGDNVYVKLEKDGGGIWRSNGVSKIKPTVGDFIKGDVINVYENRINVEYGIERFYFERNAKVSIINITVEIKVANSGRAKLVQLLQNGKPAEIKYKDFDIKE